MKPRIDPLIFSISDTFVLFGKGAERSTKTGKFSVENLIENARGAAFAGRRKICENTGQNPSEILVRMDVYNLGRVFPVYMKFVFVRNEAGDLLAGLSLDQKCALGALEKVLGMYLN